MIVDDEVFILEELAENLIEEGYECVTVDSVDAALKTIRNCFDISLILIDLRMPGKSGEDFIEMVEEDFPQIHKFIVMSGHGSSKYTSVDIRSGHINI